MGKIFGSMDCLNTLEITELTAGLDKSIKKLFEYKEIHAVILKAVVREFEPYSYQEIMDFIDKTSMSQDTQVGAGRKTSRINGSNTEYIALDEKTTVFDTVFKAANPELSTEELLIHLHIDVEMQKSYRPGYPIEKRGLYYLSRELSSQLSTVAGMTDYSDLEKCYSIWICRDDVPKDEKFSISFYEFTNTKNFGNCNPKKENYDLMNLVVIRLGNSVYNGDDNNEGYDVLRFLTAIVYPGKDGSRLNIVKDYIDFSQNLELREELGEMEGFGMSVLREGFEEGMEQERGRINLLNKKLYRDERMADLFRSLDDPEFQEQLLEEYGL